MDRHAVRGKLSDLLHGAADVIDIFLRKSDDEVHIDIVKAKISCHAEFFLHHIHGVMASDQIQSCLLHRLRIDGDPGDIVGTENFELVFGDAVRTSGFHSEFLYL